MGYYSDLIKQKQNAKEEKDNANFHYLGKSYSVTEGNYKEVRRQIERDYKEEVSKLERKISSASGSEKSSLESKLRDLKSGFKETMEEFDWGYGNEKEEGYYAKLSKEKKNGDMDKGGKIYWDCINAHKKLGRAYGNLFNAVGGVEEVINYGVDPETNFSPELARKLESWTRIIENCERQLRTIR